jgi:N-acetylglucosamine-6-phosphate deacetylase
MKAIINAELVLKDHLIPDAVVFVQDGIITGFGPMRTTEVPADCEIIDAEGLYVGPGLVDIHCHAGDNVNMCDEPYGPSRKHLKRGTTTLLAALYFSETKETLLEQIYRIKAAIGKPGAENLTGIYAEAPYMNPDYGSNRENCPWAGPIRKEDYQPLLDAAGDKIFVWALAPEREHILDFVLDAKKANPNVRFAVGHSEAEPHHIEALIPYGLCIGTHHTNATGTIVRYPECRGVCVDETVNYNSDIYAELISDRHGIHVDPYMQKLIYKIKGNERLLLVSDQSACDPNPPHYAYITDVCMNPYNGEVDGSRMYLQEGCRSFMIHTGASLVDAFRLASYNPARVIGLCDRGEIAVGKRADLIFVDHRFNVKKVLLEGNEM